MDSNFQACPQLFRFGNPAKQGEAQRPMAEYNNVKEPAGAIAACASFRDSALKMLNGGGPMSNALAAELTRKKCVSCESGVPPLPADQVRRYLAALPQWQLSEDG